MDLHDYLRVLRRQWIIVLCCVLIGAAAAAVVTLRATPLYTSNIRLFVSTPQSDTAAAYQGGLFSEQRVESYADLVTGPEIAQRVIDRLDLDESPAALGGQIKATVLPKTVILNVAVTDKDPKRAQRLAAAVGAEFTSFVQTLETPSGKSRSPIKVSVLGAPRTGSHPVSPQPVRNVGLAVLIGLLVGVAGAVLRETLDTSIRSISDLTATAGGPVLGSISNDLDATKNPLITSLDPHAPRVEAFRVLRTSLQFVNVDQATKVFVITSSMPGEGKTTTACNLALTLAQAGQRVALVEGDLRRPSLATYFGLVGSVGLTTVLIGRIDVAQAMQTWGEHGLAILTSGVVPPDPAELLQSRAMADVLADLRNAYDVILIDSPPLLPVTDAALLTAQAEGALLVVRYGKTTRDQVRTSVDRLTSVHGRLVGTLLNRARVGGGSGQYGYGYAPTERLRFAGPLSSRGETNFIEHAEGYPRDRARAAD